MKIYTIKNKKEEQFLRKKVPEFDFKTYPSGEIKELIKEMRKTMKENKGIGLSANQVGLPLRLFIAEYPFPKEKPKFYAVFNPQIIKQSQKKNLLIEGCLSVPGVIGEIERAERVVLTGYNSAGKKIKIKGFGLLAEIFQHELDHLNGILFIDKAKKTFNTDGEKIRL